MWARTAILMDEPTAALGVIQTQKVLELIVPGARPRPRRRLHLPQPPQVLEIADRIEVCGWATGCAVRRGEATSTADRRDLRRVHQRGDVMTSSRPVRGRRGTPGDTGAPTRTPPRDGSGVSLDLAGPRCGGWSPAR
jgi:hypothetical protein